LGKIGDQRAVEPLIKMLGDSVSVRNAACHALGKIGAKRADEPLIKMLRGEYDYVYISGWDDWHAVNPWFKKLSSSDVREAACEALGKLKDKRAVEPLIETLGDKDEYVRERACEALGKLKDKRAVEPLIETLGDKDEYVRERACETLGQLGDKRAVEPLRSLAENDKVPGVRKAAETALKRLENRSGTDR
jgi:HEAT repeat protein